MASYKLDFKSLQGTDYQVQIYDTSTFDEENATVLQSGADPFTTEEDDDDKPDCWVRKCTGYVRFINMGDGVPMELFTADPWSMRVRLVDKTQNKVRFRGYLKPEQYDQPMFGYRDEVEIPIASNMTMMYDKYMRNTREGIMSIGEVLYDVMSGYYDYIKIPDNSLMQSRLIETTETQGRANTGVNGVWWYSPHYYTPKATQLGFWVDNFKSEIKRTDSLGHQLWGDGPYEPCTYGELLDNICAAMGWYLCEDDDMLVLRDINQRTSALKYQKISRSELKNDATVTTRMTIPVMELSAMSFCSNDHSIETVAPFGKITVSSDARVQNFTAIDITDKDNIVTNGVTRKSSSRLNVYEVPKDTTGNGVKQYHYNAGGDVVSTYGLLNNSSIYGGELVAWSKDKSTGKSVLLQYDGGSNYVAGAIALTGNTCILLTPAIDDSRRKPYRIAAKGKVRCNDTDGEIKEGSNYSGSYLQLTGNCGSVSSNGFITISNGEMDHELYYEINYQACSRLNGWEEMTVTTPSYSSESVYPRVSLSTLKNYKHGIIDDFKLVTEVNKTDELYLKTEDYGKVEYAKVLIPYSTDNSLEVNTKFGIMDTDGAFMMHYKVPLAVRNPSSPSDAFRYAWFKDLQTKYIGTTGTFSDVLKRVFDNLVIDGTRQKLTVHVRNEVNYLTQVQHDGKTYVPISRKWNYRDDDCELVLLEVISDDEPLPENAVILTCQRVFVGSSGCADYFTLDRAIDCDLTVVYKWTNTSGVEQTTTITITAGNTSNSTGHAPAKEGFKDGDIQSTTLSEPDAYTVKINIID